VPDKLDIDPKPRTTTPYKSKNLSVSHIFPGIIGGQRCDPVNNAILSLHK